MRILKSILDKVIQFFGFKCYSKLTVPLIVYFETSESEQQNKKNIQIGIDLANKLFSSINVNFIVEQCVIQNYSQHYIHENDAENWAVVFDDVLPIYTVKSIQFNNKTNYIGFSSQLDFCNRFNLIVYPIVNSAVVAHELGHSFGLDHVKDPDNLMSPFVAPIDKIKPLTKKQLLIVRTYAEDFVRGCVINHHM